MDIVGYKVAMPKPDEEPFVQLATRIPKSLHRSMKLHTVVAEQSMMAFVVKAIEEKLAREEGKRRKRA